MDSASYRVPQPLNEPAKGYGPGSPERAELKKQIAALRGQTMEIPLIIGGKEVRTGNLGECRIPHEHGHLLARYHKAGQKEILQAIEVAREARITWSRYSWQERVAISLKAAELISKERRSLLNAATMLGQSKTAHQAEIDAACELIDFLRFNPYFMQGIYQTQPENLEGTWNRMEYRPLEGFILAITPFNFTAIGGNLPTTPALMGNVVLWKPATTAIYSNYQVMRALMEAGLPDGVINFLPGDSGEIGDFTLSHRELAGVHFTGSNHTFNRIWEVVARNLSSYWVYPRIVGETGGKNFLVAHQSADVKGLAANLIRGAFEYQGQKCSATSRAYIPKTIWPSLRDEVFDQLARVKVGPVEDFSNFMGAVIDRAAFQSIREYIHYAESSEEAEVLYGGGCDDSVGYFIQPTLVLTRNPHFKLMEEEIFGPVLTIYLYEDDAYEEMLELCNRTSPYGLTGAVFANDRHAIHLAEDILRDAAGNFYINDKTTGAVVGHQPFGGARASGTNDKAGSIYNLFRWISVRTIKETFCPSEDFSYPFLAE